MFRVVLLIVILMVAVSCGSKSSNHSPKYMQENRANSAFQELNKEVGR